MPTQDWEQILSTYGLSEKQIDQQDIQTLVRPGKQKPRVPEHHGEWLEKLAEREGNDLENIHRVRQRFTSREVPWWANDDKLIAAFLFHKHPGLRTLECGKRGAQCAKAARDRAARDVARIYLAFRAGWHDADIAGLLSVEIETIRFQLWEIRTNAEKFFAKQNAAAGVVDYNVRIHNCHATGDKKPVSCRCKKYVTHDEAAAMVKRGEAEWRWVYPPRDKAFQTHTEIVAARTGKTPRSNTLEKAHMQRNTEGNEEQQASVEVFGELARQVIAELIVPFKPDARQGMPVLTVWGDERTTFSYN